MGNLKKALLERQNEDEVDAEIERLFNSAPVLTEDKINRDYPKGEHGEYRSGHEFEINEEDLEDEDEMHKEELNILTPRQKAIQDELKSGKELDERDHELQMELAAKRNTPGLSRKALVGPLAPRLSEEDKAVVDRILARRLGYMQTMKALKDLRQLAKERGVFDPEVERAAMAYVVEYFNKEKADASDERMQSAPTTGSRHPGLTVVADAVLKNIFNKIMHQIDSGVLGEAKAASLRETLQGALMSWLENERTAQAMAPRRRLRLAAMMETIATGDTCDKCGEHVRDNCKCPAPKTTEASRIKITEPGTQEDEDAAEIDVAAEGLNDNTASGRRAIRLAMLNKISEGEVYDANMPWPEGKPKRFGEPGYEEFLALSQEREDKEKAKKELTKDAGLGVSGLHALEAMKKKKKDVKKPAKKKAAPKKVDKKKARKKIKKAFRTEALRALGQYFQEPTGIITVEHNGRTYELGVSVHWHGKLEAGDGYPDFEIETAKRDGVEIKLNEDGRVKLIELAESQEGSGWAELNDQAMSQVPN